MLIDKKVFLDEMEMIYADTNVNARERAFISCSFDFVTSDLLWEKGLFFNSVLITMWSN